MWLSLVCPELDESWGDSWGSWSSLTKTSGPVAYLNETPLNSAMGVDNLFEITTLCPLEKQL